MGEEKTETYSLEEIKQMEGRTDWERVDRMTGGDVEAATREDPDAELWGEDWMGTAEVILPGDPF